MKLCPLKYGKNYTLHLDKAKITGIEELGKCDGDKCAWWDEAESQCCILSIMMELNSIYHNFAGDNNAK